MNTPPEWRRECDACEGEGTAEHPHMPLHTARSEAPEYATVTCEDCGGEGWKWTDDPVTLAECRPGPFWFNGSLGFKTEYGMTLPNGMGMWTVTNWPEAYCMDSGECFWGGTSTHDDRAKLLVWPVEHLGYEAGLAEGRREVEQRFRHKKRGTVYTVIGEAELQAAHPQAEHAALVIYRGDDGKLWARNSGEFYDGRFEPLPTTSGENGK